MKRFLIFISGILWLITALHGQALNRDAVHVSPFFGYPLTMGDVSTENLQFSVNKLLPVNVESYDLPRWQIGAVPDHTVWHEGNVTVGFYVLTDTLQATGVSLTYKTSPEPKGEIRLYESGRFLYYPDKTDVRDITVTFTAQAGSKKITQDVLFRMMATTKPEYAAFGLEPNKPLPPSGDNYVIVAENRMDEMLFNHSLRSVRSFSISGKELSSGSRISNSLTISDLSGQEDIFELNLYAETVTIRDVLHLPGTKVTIYAKELIFEGNGAINTSPVEWDGRYPGFGAPGDNAGDIALYIKNYRHSSPHTRFIQKGGKGQDTEGVGTMPGNGGKGGVLTSTIDVRGFSDRSGGAAGVQYQSATSDLIVSVGAPGFAGNFDLHGGKFTWLHPNVLMAVVKHGKDAYRNLYNAFTYEVFSGYLQELANYRKSEDEWNSLEFHEQMELRNAKYEMQALVYSISQNRDFFGNPIGWVPMLSFEVNKAAFEQEIERAVRVMYLNYWLNSIDRINAERTEERIAGYEKALEEVGKELAANIEVINKLVGNISGLKSQADILQTDTEDIIKRVEQKRDELVAKAEKAEKEKNNKKIWGYIWGGIAIVAGAAVSIGSFGMATPVGAALIGVGVCAGSASLADQIWADQINVEFDKNARDYLNSINFVIVANVDLSSIENAYVNFSETVSPIIDGIENLQTAFEQSYVDNEFLQEEINRVAATTSEFRPFVDELKVLNGRKADFIRELGNFNIQITMASVEITRCIATADGYREIIEILKNNIEGSDLRAMQYLDDMDRRARERLHKYHYYMAKSFEYRLLKPYTAELDLEKFMKGLIAKAEENPDIQFLDREDFRSVVVPLYESLLSEVTSRILDEYNTNRPQVRTAFAFKATESDLAMLNAGTGFNLNMFERGWVLTNHENARIVDFKIYDMKVRLEGNQNPDGAHFELLLEHSGRSMIRNNGEIYWFDHINDRNTNPITWGAFYNHIKKDDDRITQHGPSPDEESLLYSILTGLKKTDEFVIFSRPGVWSDIRISKNVPSGVSSNMIIEELTFELIYDFTQRPSNNRNVDVYTAEVVRRNNSQSASSIQRSDVSEASESVRRNWLTPYIEISEEDVNKRTDGRGPIYRTYNSAKDVTFTAPEEYGRYRFVNWTDHSGAEISTNLSVNRRLTGDVALTANYRWTGPILYAPETVTVDGEAGEKSIDVTAENTEDDDIEWKVESNSEWLTVKGTGSGKNNGSFTVSFTANPDTEKERTGYVTIIPEDEGAEPVVVAVIQSKNETSATATESIATPLVNVYPNPTDGVITIETMGHAPLSNAPLSNAPLSEGYMVTITDMAGKILLRQTVSDQITQLDVSAYPSGVYLLTIDDGKRQSVMRVVKN